MNDRLLDRIAAGGATLSTVHWRRLREALNTTDEEHQS